MGVHAPVVGRGTTWRDTMEGHHGGRNVRREGEGRTGGGGRGREKEGQEGEVHVCIVTLLINRATS